MSSKTNALADYIAQLEERTRAGDIRWSSATASAYAATRDTASGRKRMTILRVPMWALSPFGKSPSTADGGAREAVPEAYFLFLVEAIDSPNKQSEMMIDTREKPELYVAFQQLFDAAKSSVDAQSAHILKELVG